MCIRDRWDAARLYGSSHLNFLLKVVIPMSKPIIVTVSLFTFIIAWNSFAWPLLILTRDDWYPVTVSIYSFVREVGPNFNLLMAACLIAIFPILKIGGMQLFQTEFSSKDEKVLPRTTKIATGIGLVYLALTILCAFLLFATGLSTFDSIAHGMTIIATGGFSTKDMSIGSFDSVSTEVVTISFMIISSLPFILLFQAMRGKVLYLFKILAKVFAGKGYNCSTLINTILSFFDCSLASSKSK